MSGHTDAHLNDAVLGGKLSQWRVDFVSGSFVDWVEVDAKDMLDAIDKASSAFSEEQDPLWPWQANEAVISVRRLDK